MDQSKSALEEWGETLARLRKAKGLTQMDVCRETGAAAAAVYRWEAGRARPQVRFVRKLRDMFPDLPELPQEAATGSSAA